MGLLRIPLSSPWCCTGCGYPVRGLPRSGDCPECGLRVTATIVDQSRRDRDEELFRRAVAAEWRRGRGKAVLLGLSAMVWAIAAGSAVAGGTSPGFLLGLSAVSLVSMGVATTLALALLARIGLLTCASYLSLAVASFTGASVAVAVGAFLMQSGSGPASLAATAIVLLGFVMREFDLDSQAVPVLIAANVLAAAVVMVATA